MSILQQPLSKVKPPGRRETALQYHAMGMNIVALGPNKRPLAPWKSSPDWTAQRQSAADVEAMRWRHAVGLAAVVGEISDGLVCVDFDKQADHTAVTEFLELLSLPYDYAWQVRTGSGWHVWLRSPAFPLNGTGKLDREGLNGGHIELRYRGMMATLPPSQHPSGARYEFANEDPDGPPVTVSAETVIAAYDSVTVKPTPPQDPPYKPRAPELPSDAEELTIVRLRAMAEAVAKLHKRGNKPGYFVCPIEGHGTGGKDFLIDLDTGAIGGCQGKHAGQLTRWVDFCEFMGVDVGAIARDVAVDRRAEVTTRSHTSTRFGKGLPYTLNKRLLNAHHKTKVKSQRPAALVLFVWNEPGFPIVDGSAFTAGEFQRATEEIGRNLSRDTVETGLEQLLAWGICDKWSLPYSQEKPSPDAPSLQNDQLDRLQESQVQRYRLRTAAEQLVAFEEHYTYLEREKAYSAAPDNVQPEWGDLDAEDIQQLDLLRADLYAERAVDRELAAGSLAKNMQRMVRHSETIRAGTYRVIILPAGELRNGQAYIDALYLSRLEASGGERTEAYKEQFELGVSDNTLSRMRQRLDVITVPQTATIACEAVTERQRRNGLVLSEKDGQAVVRVPCSEKLKSRAKPEEIKAYDELRETQRERANSRKHRDLSTTAGREARLLDVQRHTVPPGASVKPLIIPRAYSDGHMLRQFEMTPGAEEIARFDTGTGEVFTPSQLWRALADKLRGLEPMGSTEGVLPMGNNLPDHPNLQVENSATSPQRGEKLVTSLRPDGKLEPASPDVGKAVGLCDVPGCMHRAGYDGKCAGHYRPSPEFLAAERKRIAAEKQRALQLAMGAAL